MTGSSQIALRTYRVDVEFYCGDLQYGAESYSITAASWYLAEREALLRSVGSVYDDDSIPDRRRLAKARQV